MPIPSQGTYIKEANLLIDSKGLREGLPALIDEHKALLLNAFVNSFCESTENNKDTIEELFVDCQTACGGQSLVLAELLGAVGIEARLFNIYNVPIQGNHTMVEAQIDGRWILLDPTFGVMMRHNGELLNIDQLKALVSDNHDAEAIIWQSPDVPLESITADSPIASYEPGFRSGSFQIEGYYTFEASGVYSPDSLVLLSADLYENKNLSGIELLDPTPTSISNAFLEFTNAILNGQIAATPISYLFHFIGSRGVQFRQRLRLHFSSYQNVSTVRLGVIGYNQYDTPLQVDFYSNDLIPLRLSRSMPPGHFSIDLEIPPDILRCTGLCEIEVSLADLDGQSRHIQIYDYRLDAVQLSNQD